MKECHKNHYDVSNFNDRLHNPYKRTFGMSYCKDHLEVFIENVK